MCRVILTALLFIYLVMPVSAQTAGSWPPGDPSIAPALRQAIRSSDHSYALALPDGAHDNNTMLRDLFSRGIPSPRDRDLGAAGKSLASQVDTAAKQPEYLCSLFSITAAFAFIGPSPPVILAVSSPCGSAVLVRSRTGKPPAAVADIEWSPQFQTHSFEDLLKSLPAPGSTR
jgi:hypothetical protein